MQRTVTSHIVLDVTQTADLVFAIAVATAYVPASESLTATLDGAGRLWSNKDRGSSPPGGWPTMRIRVVTAIGSCRRRRSVLRASSASNTAAGRRSMPVDPSNR